MPGPDPLSDPDPTEEANVPRQTLQERKHPCPGIPDKPCGTVAVLDARTGPGADGVPRCISCNVKIIAQQHGIG